MKVPYIIISRSRILLACSGFLHLYSVSRYFTVLPIIIISNIFHFYQERVVFKLHPNPEIGIPIAVILLKISYDALLLKAFQHLAQMNFCNSPLQGYP